MDERDLEAEHTAARLGVDELGACARELGERSADVRHLVGDVVHPGAALREEAPDGRVLSERCEQLDTALADADRRRLDALLVDPRAVLDAAAEQPLVRPHRLVEVLDGDADVVDAADLHTAIVCERIGGMRMRAPLAVLLAAALVAGCGGSGTRSNGEASKSAAQVLADARGAATHASAVHVVGRIESGGTPLAVDLYLDRGKGGKGSIAESGVRFDLVRLGGKAYIRGSDAFYRKFAGSAAAQLLRGKWLVGSASTGDLAPLVSITDIGKLFGGVTATHGALRNEGETTFHGEKAVAIRDATRGGTLYVAAAGTPYPLALVGKGSSGTVRFEGWNEVVPISAPRGAIDLGKLQSGG